MRDISEVIVHCTATRPEWWAGETLAAKIAEVRSWHVDGNGWRDIGYHYLIDRNGEVGKGRHVAQVGAHVRGHNTGSIGVALFGGHGSAETDKFGDNFTPEQDAALRRLLAELQDRFGPLRIAGHNEYAAKACPGFNVAEWLTGSRPEIAPPPASRPAKGMVGVITAFAALAGSLATIAYQWIFGG